MKSRRILSDTGRGFHPTEPILPCVDAITAERELSLRPSSPIANLASVVSACGLVFYLIAYLYFRSLSGIGLGFGVACAAVLVISNRKTVVNVPLGWIISIATVYFFFSVLGLMPKAWTQYFDRVAAFRHYMWVIVVPLFASAFYIVFRNYSSNIVRNIFVAILTMYVFSRIAYVLGGQASFYSLTLYGVNNATTPLLAMVILFCYSGSNIYVSAARCLAFIPMLTSQTNLSAGMVALSVILFGRAKFISGSFCAAVFGFVLIAPMFFIELNRVDDNTGIRALFWHDAIEAVTSTGGVGVGFGTEYIRNDFSAIRAGSWAITGEDEANRLFISTHSGFYDVFLRMGILGAGALLAYFLSIFNGVNTENIRISGAYYSIVSLLVVSVLLNPALVSIDICIGTSFLLGILQYLKYLSWVGRGAGGDFGRRRYLRR